MAVAISRLLPFSHHLLASSSHHPITFVTSVLSVPRLKMRRLPPASFPPRLTQSACPFDNLARRKRADIRTVADNRCGLLRNAVPDSVPTKLAVLPMWRASASLDARNAQDLRPGQNSTPSGGVDR